MLKIDIEYLKTLNDNSLNSFINQVDDILSIDFWKEVYRIIKPGGYILSFDKTKTFHRSTLNIEDAGFSIRDTIVYHFDKNSQLICLAQKPISEKTIVDNVLRWGVGGINIDGCRNPTNDKMNGGPYNYSEFSGFGFKRTNEMEYKQHQQGRWPANLILSHHPECIETDEVITLNEGKERKRKLTPKNIKNLELNFLQGAKSNYQGGLGEEKIKKYICHDDCPLKIMDEQSGYSKSTDNIRTNKDKKKSLNDGWGLKPNSSKGHSDEGGASRFFYCAKSKDDLIEYLIKMINPKNGNIIIKNK